MALLLGSTDTHSLINDTHDCVDDRLTAAATPNFLIPQQ